MLWCERFDCSCSVTLDYEVLIVGGLFFFKQKTAYEMRISDWSSDVCSSDLFHIHPEKAFQRHDHEFHRGVVIVEHQHLVLARLFWPGTGLGGNPGLVSGTGIVLPAGTGPGKWQIVEPAEWLEIGRASCRARVCQSV